jgi:preprotein translocase subunit SecY
MKAIIALLLSLILALFGFFWLSSSVAPAQIAVSHFSGQAEHHEEYLILKKLIDRTDLISSILIGSVPLLGAAIGHTIRIQKKDQLSGDSRTIEKT